MALANDMRMLSGHMYLHEELMLDEWLPILLLYYLCDTVVSAAISHLLLDDLDDALLLFVGVQKTFRWLELFQSCLRIF